MNMTNKYYFWLDTDNGYLYKGQYSETGERLRDTETAVLRIPQFEDYCAAEEEYPLDTWEQIDAYIKRFLGYLPDYEIN